MGDTAFVPGGVLRLCKSPWPSLAIGAGCGLISWAILSWTGTFVVLLPFLAMTALGVGVAIRPSSSLVLLAAAAGACLAWLGMPEEWDTLRLVIAVLAVLAFVSAGLVALPVIWRRAVVSLLILFHLAGIGCAVTRIDPAPWLTQYLWAHCFRYYLDFVYLNNAYHFYAPEPGPGCLLWFYVKYDDGSMQLVDIPNRATVPTLLNFQRRLSIPEAVNTFVALPGIPPNITYARLLAGERDGIWPYDGKKPNPLEYRAPIVTGRRMLESYAQHVAKTTPHPTDPNRKVVSVKIYRVVHRLIMPKELLAGVRSEKVWMCMPYYQGEFDPDGKLMDPNDPYLYWLIPIVNAKNPDLSSNAGVNADDHAAANQDADIRNGLETHLRVPTAKPQPVAVPEGGPPGARP